MPEGVRSCAAHAYSLRHLFSTLLTERHAADAAHDRMLGHCPKDTKTLNYSAKLLPFLAVELERIPLELPEHAPTFGADKAAVIDEDGVGKTCPPQYAA